MPPPLSEYVPHLQKGCLYAYKRDKGQRPIFVISVMRLLEQKLEPSQVATLSICFLEFCIEHLFIPGVIENNFVIMDCEGITLANAPRDLMVAIIGVL